MASNLYLELNQHFSVNKNWITRKQKTHTQENVLYLSPPPTSQIWLNSFYSWLILSHPRVKKCGEKKDNFTTSAFCHTTGGNTFNLKNSRENSCHFIQEESLQIYSTAAFLLQCKMWGGKEKLYDMCMLVSGELSLQLNMLMDNIRFISLSFMLCWHGQIKMKCFKCDWMWCKSAKDRDGVIRMENQEKTCMCVCVHKDQISAANKGTADFQYDLMIKRGRLTDPLCISAEECACSCEPMSRCKWSVWHLRTKGLN